MDKDGFEDRRKALEEAFFSKQNAELLSEMRARHEGETQRKALEEASGVSEPEVLDELIRLGIGVEDLAALSLVPLVAVAWADHDMSERERDAILSATQEAGIAKGSAAYDLIAGWVAKRPAADLLDAWTEYTKAVAGSMSRGAAERLRDDVVGRARRVAEAAGGFLGIGAVSAPEKELLANIARAFG